MLTLTFICSLALFAINMFVKHDRSAESYKCRRRKKNTAIVTIELCGWTMLSSFEAQFVPRCFIAWNVNHFWNCTVLDVSIARTM